MHWIAIILLLLAAPMAKGQSAFAFTLGTLGGDGGVSATAMISTWELAGADTVTLPLRSGYTYDFTVDWGDGSALSTVTAFDDADRIHNYTAGGTKTVTIEGDFTCLYFSTASAGVKALFRTIEQWGDIQLEQMNGAFYLCLNATSYADFPYMPVNNLSYGWSGNTSMTTFPVVSNLIDNITLFKTWEGCSSGTNFSYVNTQTNVNSLKATWKQCIVATSFPEVSALTNVNSLDSTWAYADSATVFPEVNTLTKVTTLKETWKQCIVATSFPDVDALTNVITLHQTWLNCGTSTSFPEVNTQTNVNSLKETWQNCSSATSFPDVDALTKVTTLDSTWAYADSATVFPEVNTLTKVTTLKETWRECDTATSFPEVSALTNVNSLSTTWRECSSATNLPDVSALTNVTTYIYAWYKCAGLTTVPVLPSSSTALITTTGAFQSIGSGMTGTVVELWDTNNFPNVSSYADTFTGATGLDNYADIPDNWKGL